MKQLLKILVFMAVGQTVYGQIYTKPNNSYGLIWNRGRFDSTIFLPTRCGTPAGLPDLSSTDQNMMALQFDSCGHRLYLFDPSLKSWFSTSGASQLNDSVFVVGLDTVTIRGTGGGTDPSKVPLTRTITINGNSQDLSANRTWTLTKSDIGLGNVDNTSDVNKPVSTAQQAALDLKLNKTDTSSMLSGYTRRQELADTANAIRTGIATPNLEQVTNTGSTYTSSHTIIQGANNITYTSTGGFHNFDSLKVKNRYTGALESLTKFISNNQDSLVILAGVMRGVANPSRSDSLDWYWIRDAVHSTQNVPTIPIQFKTSLSTGQVTMYYPIQNYKVVSLMFGPDEQLQGYGLTIGASVDPDSAQIFASIPFTNGGYGYWGGSSWVNISDPGGTITQDATTGKISVPIATLRNIGGITDQSRQALVQVGRANASYQTGLGRPVVDPFGSNATTLAVYIVDSFGDAILPSNMKSFNGFQMVGVTGYSRVNLCQQTGTLAWQKNIFNSLSNIWVIGVFKKI